MRSFRYSLPATDLIFGEGSLQCLGAEVRKIGKKALLVTGKKSMKKLGFLKKSCGNYFHFWQWESCKQVCCGYKSDNEGKNWNNESLYLSQTFYCRY